MTGRRFTEYEVDLALREAALRDLGSVLGDQQAERLYRTDTGFHVAVNALLRAGWWPHSLDVETRQASADNEALAKQAASMIPLELP